MIHSYQHIAFWALSRVHLSPAVIVKLSAKNLTALAMFQSTTISHSRLSALRRS